MLTEAAAQVGYKIHQRHQEVSAFFGQIRTNIVRDKARLVGSTALVGLLAIGATVSWAQQVENDQEEGGQTVSFASGETLPTDPGLVRDGYSLTLPENWEPFLHHDMEMYHSKQLSQQFKKPVASIQIWPYQFSEPTSAKDYIQTNYLYRDVAVKPEEIQLGEWPGFLFKYHWKEVDTVRIVVAKGRDVREIEVVLENNSQAVNEAGQILNSLSFRPLEPGLLAEQ